jgi:hypothetical protein
VRKYYLLNISIISLIFIGYAGEYKEQKILNDNLKIKIPSYMRLMPKEMLVLKYPYIADTNISAFSNADATTCLKVYLKN